MTDKSITSFGSKAPTRVDREEGAPVVRVQEEAAAADEPGHTEPGFPRVMVRTSDDGKKVRVQVYSATQASTRAWDGFVYESEDQA